MTVRDRGTVFEHCLLQAIQFVVMVVAVVVAMVEPVLRPHGRARPLRAHGLANISLFSNAPLDLVCSSGSKNNYRQQIPCVIAN